MPKGQDPFERGVPHIHKESILKLNITIDGKSYEVDVEVTEDDRGPSLGPVPYYSASPTSVASAPPPLPVAGGAPGSNGHVTRESLPQPDCRPRGAHQRAGGSADQVNDPILVLEAMKMETNITAPVAGKIKAINVAVGDAVQVRHRYGGIRVNFIKRSPRTG